MSHGSNVYEIPGVFADLIVFLVYTWLVSFQSASFWWILTSTSFTILLRNCILCYRTSGQKLTQKKKRIVFYERETLQSTIELLYEQQLVRKLLQLKARCDFALKISIH